MLNLEKRKNSTKKISKVLNSINKLLLSKNIDPKKELSFVKESNYNDFTSYIGDISKVKIIGCGNNAYVLNHKNISGWVIKLGKPGGDNIRMEVDNHNTFYSTLRKLKQRGLINEKIKVPKINDYGSMNYFEMEKVNGISLANYYYKIKFKDKLNKYDDEYINDLNDLELKKLFKKVGVKDILEQMNEDQKEGDKMYAELYKFSEKFLEPYGFGLAMMIMEELGILHKDLHPGNLMIDKDKNVYIIDFGRVYIDNYLNNLK